MRLRDRVRRMRLARLNGVQVAAPCPVRWEEMEGDDKIRFCGECRLHVFDLSAMDVEEAALKIAQADDRLCVHFYRRPDGTILTQDCPVGQELAHQRRRQLLGRTVASLAGAGVMSQALVPVTGTARPASQRAALHSAAKAGDLERLRRFLDAGFDPDWAFDNGKTPLMSAAGLGRGEAVRLLLQYGAALHQADAQGRTALDYARTEGHRAVVDLLEAHSRR